MGTKECALQFSKRRWNCTTVRKSMKKVLERDTREAAFVHAITTAGVTYAVAQACSLGLLLECRSVGKREAKSNFCFSECPVFSSHL